MRGRQANDPTKRRERERQRRRERLWGNELIALARVIRFGWRYSRSERYRKQVRARARKRLLHSLGPAYRAWRWHRAYRRASPDKRRQMLGRAIFGERVVSVWRYIRSDAMRARYRAMRRLSITTLRAIVVVARWTGRHAIRGGRALARSYKQQWYVSGYTRADGTYVRGHYRHRRSV